MNHFKSILFSLSLIIFVSLSALAAPTPVKPDHLVLMVFDQMRPDYVDRYDLKNFKRLRKISQNYTQAIVGHLGSVTVVSHFVISSGLQPKAMPWHDELFKDAAGLLGEKDKFYVAGDLSTDQFMTLMKTVPQETLLPALIKKKLGGSVIAIGEKAYATTTFGTSQADRIITFQKTNGVCKPAGIQVPDYILSNDRFTVECKNTYGTEGSLYPLDGAKSVPGNDPKHLGGDIWVGDVAEEVLAHEKDWRGLFLTFAGIDRVGHVLGDLDRVHPHSFSPQYSFVEILQIADQQLGRVLDSLEKNKMLDRTLIVATADHGGQTDDVYLGNGGKSHGGKVFAGSEKNEQAYFIQRLLNTGEVLANYQDTMIHLWCAEGKANDPQLIKMLSETSGLSAIYSLNHEGDHYFYQNVYSNLKNFLKPFQTWANAHDQGLVDSMAAPDSPNLLGLLGDGVGFDLPGDHGGTQELVQRIPVFFAIPGVPGKSTPTKIRLVDLKEKIIGLMDL
jgi:hypothetical protein